MDNCDKSDYVQNGEADDSKRETACEEEVYPEMKIGAVEIPQPLKNFGKRSLDMSDTSCSQKTKKQLVNVPPAIAVSRELEQIRNDGSQKEPSAPTEVSSPVRDPCAIQLDTSNFRELVRRGSFVDKTMLIKDFIESAYFASFLISPRRVGKTTNMDMIKTFLEIKVDEKGNQKSLESRENYKLFTEKGLKISQYPEFMQVYLGQYPVISVSFAEVRGDNYDAILNGIKQAISNSYKQHEYMINVLRAGSLFDDDSASFKGADEINIMWSLRKLSKILYDKFKKRVYVLVDEFDTPLNSKINNITEDDRRRVYHLLESVVGWALKGCEHVKGGLLTGTSFELRPTLGTCSLDNICVFDTENHRTYAQYYGFSVRERKAV